MSLPLLYHHLHTAILEKDAAPAVADVRPNPKFGPEHQLAVYINGYRLRLIQAIRSDYPALLLLLGEKEFDRRAIDYIEKNPPSHFNLDRYPIAFAAGFAEGFAADLARYESAIAEVFMLEESAPLDPASLGGLSPEAFGSLQLSLRTASRLLALQYPAEDYLLAMREGETPAPPAALASYYILVRHDNEVRRHALSESAYRALSSIAEGHTVGEALAVATDAGEVSSWFGEWVGWGILRAKEPQ